MSERPLSLPPPVPAPGAASAVPSKSKLSASDLGKLPPPMSMKDRVHRYRKGPETPPSPNSDADDNIAADSPDTTPPWQPTEEERRVIWPENSKTSVDKTFEIDTTKSFLDAPKPAGNLI